MAFTVIYNVKVTYYKTTGQNNVSSFNRHAGRVTVQLPRVLAKPLNLTTPLPSSRTLGAIMRGAFNDGLRNGRHHGTPRTPRDATGRHGRQAADAKRQVQALYWVLRLMNFCSKVV